MSPSAYMCVLGDAHHRSVDESVAQCCVERLSSQLKGIRPNNTIKISQ